MLAVSVLGSGIAALDATVVNIALPTIGRDFRTGVAALQWVMNGVGAALLVPGSLAILEASFRPADGSGLACS